MAQQVNPPRGMRDFLPDDKARRDRIMGVIRDAYRARGFREIETPVMEDASRLHAGLGGDNEKLAFAVMRRGLSSEDLTTAGTPLELADLGLRYDLTVPLARFYASHQGHLPTVMRALQMAPVWRAERPQKGRFRQFVQCDIDIVGSEDALAEVEVLTAGIAAIEALGIVGSSVRINDRRLLIALLNHFGFPVDQHDRVLITVDKLDKIAATGVIAELREWGADDAAVDALAAYLGDSGEPGLITGSDAIRAQLPDGLEHEAIDDLAAIADAVTQGGSAAATVVFDPWLVRGMGYYTGTIFEIGHPDLGYSFGGGGRYDGMIGRFLGRDVPAVGFSLGFERLVELVALDSAQDEPVIAVLYDRSSSPATVVGARERFVGEGYRVHLEPRPKKLGARLSALTDAGVAAFVVLEPDTTVAELVARPLAHASDA